MSQADVNTARVLSGTSTPEQFKDFQRQLEEVENGGGRAYFPGDPDSLPESVPERVCGCGKSFRTRSVRKDAECFDCTLARIQRS